MDFPDMFVLLSLRLVVYSNNRQKMKQRKNTNKDRWENERTNGLSTAGRRNSVGIVLGAREDPWLSGTMHAFSLLLFGNSHTAVNFRLLLCKVTHMTHTQCDRGCLSRSSQSCSGPQAARRSTRYFTGYLKKPQPLRRKELKKLQQAAKELHFLDTTQGRSRQASASRGVRNASVQQETNSEFGARNRLIMRLTDSPGVWRP